jgi:TolB protein
MIPWLIFPVLSAFLFSQIATTAGNSGIFSGSTDIGVTRTGSSKFDPATVTYTVAGGGANMWETSDAFRFDWQTLTGDAAVTATILFPPGAHVPHQKAVLIFRQSLDPSSAYADVAVHADGLLALQYRAAPGAATADIAAAQAADTAKPVTARIVREGDRYTAWAAGSDGHLAQFASQTVALGNPLFVGIGVCAHEADGMATVTFSHVAVDRHPRPAPPVVN